MVESANKQWNDVWNAGDYLVSITDVRELIQAINHRQAAAYSFPELPYLPPEDGDVASRADYYNAPMAEIKFAATTGETFKGWRFNWQFCQYWVEQMARLFAPKESIANSPDSKTSALAYSWVPDPRGSTVNLGYWGITKKSEYSTGPRKFLLDPQSDPAGNVRAWPGPHGWKRVFTRTIYRTDFPGSPGQRATMLYDKQWAEVGYQNSGETDNQTVLDWMAANGQTRFMFGFPAPYIGNGLFRWTPLTPAKIAEIKNNSGLVYECVAYGNWRLAGNMVNNAQVDEQNKFIYPDDVVKYGDYELNGFGNPNINGLIEDGDIIGVWIPNDVTRGLKRLSKLLVFSNDNAQYGNQNNGQTLPFYAEYRYRQQTKKDNTTWQSGFAPFPYNSSFSDSRAYMGWDEAAAGGTSYAFAYLANTYKFVQTGSSPIVYSIFPAPEADRFSFPYTLLAGEHEFRAALAKAASLWGSNTPEHTAQALKVDFAYEKWSASHTFEGMPAIGDKPIVSQFPYDPTKQQPPTYQPPHLYISGTRDGVSAERHRSAPIVYNVGLHGRRKDAELFGVFTPASNYIYGFAMRPGYTDGDTEPRTIGPVDQNFQITNLGTLTIFGPETRGNLISANAAFPNFRYDVGLLAVAAGNTNATIAEQTAAQDTINAFADGYSLYMSGALIDFESAYTDYA